MLINLCFYLQIRNMAAAAAEVYVLLILACFGLVLGRGGGGKL